MIHIVLIDDDKNITDLIISFLSTENCSIFSTNSSKIGIDHIKNNDVDLLITDILMPEIDGLEVISEITKLKPKLKIMAISGGGAINTNQYLSLASGLGAHKVLQKPFVVADLLSALKELFPDS
jgi:DNA-binding NtrC family response regulator